MIEKMAKKRREVLQKAVEAGISPTFFGLSSVWGIIGDPRTIEASEEITARGLAYVRWLDYAPIIACLTGTGSARLPIEEQLTQYSVHPSFPHGQSGYTGGIFALQDLLMYLGPLEAFLRGFLSPSLDLDLVPWRLLRLAAGGGTPEETTPVDISGEGSGNGEVAERPREGGDLRHRPSGWGDNNGVYNTGIFNTGIFNTGTIIYCPRGCPSGSLPDSPRSGGETYPRSDSTEYVPEGTMTHGYGETRGRPQNRSGRGGTGADSSRNGDGTDGGDGTREGGGGTGNSEAGGGAKTSGGESALPALPAPYQEVVREINEILKRYIYTPIAEVETPGDVMREVEYEDEFITRKHYSLIPGSFPSPNYDPQRRIVVTPEYGKKRRMPEHIVNEIEGVVRKYTGLDLRDWYESYKRDLFPGR